MKRELSGGITSKKRFVGKSDFSAKQVSTTLLLLLLCLLMPQKGWAEIITTTYDFEASVRNNNTTMEESGQTVKIGSTTCSYLSVFGNISDPSRFARQNSELYLRKSSGNNPTYGLYNGGSGGRMLVISNLYSGDVVTFNASATPTLANGNAEVSSNVFTVKAKGDLAVNVPRGGWIYSITVSHDDAASYSYDPAVEIYDLFYVTTQDISSTNLTSAGFPLDFDDLEAQYLTNLQGGMALNNRIAISQVMYNGNTLTPWTLQNQGGLKSQWNWHNLAICNLKEGDRVVIQLWSGEAKFSSKAENTAYNGCAAFKDVQNNGDFDEADDTYVTCGMSVESQATYVITEDGHLDIALAADAIISKITIYGDHQARMVDRYGNTPSDGNTSYFDTTGQLEAKHHIVPGGLHVYVGNEDEAHHAEVVMSDKGPVSFVYDQSHFKMARHSAWGSVNVSDGLPVTGTYYKFVPDVSGTMTVRLKANSITYRNYGIAGNAAIDQSGTPNEMTSNVECPYYLMQANGNGFTPLSNPTKGNGADLTFSTEVTAGQTYYIYGWWQDGTNSDNLSNYYCGVAQLIDVTFKPQKYIYPLAKWVDSGATVANEPELSNLAAVNGYTDVCVKKKSDNIESCAVAIDGGTLKVTNISYKAGANPGGTVLIKVGDKNNDADPVFALTIAYNASYNPQIIGKDAEDNDVTRSEGHTWNFSENTLHGLKWNNKNSEADVTDFGTHFNGFATADKDENGVPTNGVNSNSFLTEEINKGDWTFNYRVKKNGTFYDPRFLNNYDMEGDNADMMWDTEGLIINAGSSQSCIFNEHGVSIDHTNKTQADPDRYIGFLEGGSFIIPKLKENDRVIIYMGSGNGSGSQAMKFNITNALDAMHNPIDPADEYFAGGSLWNTIDDHKDPYYRGCYHFYAAADGDMEFKMVGGSMCKLYSIKIYSGEREETNGVQENSGGYTILATKDQEGNVTTATNSWNLHYRGKGETIADGNGKFSQINEIIASSATITHNANTDLVRVGNQGVSYTNQGEIGMLRIRVKCMEYNHNYVTDFSDRNITLALHETKSYPYTWDFTDMKGWEATATDIATENTNYDESNDDYETKGRDISIWDENGAIILYGPTWGYVNQNMLFENSKGINGNQLWANDKVIPETQGLWFYMDNNDASYNGSMQITNEGLRLANTKKMQADGNTNLTMGWWNYKMVVPAVPAGAAVYLRMKRDPNVGDGDYSQKPNEAPVYFLNTKFHFGTDAKTELSTDNEVKNGTNYSFYKVAGSTDEWILAVKNNKGAASNLTFTLNGWIVEKMSVSEYSKSVNKLGYASESRDVEIDPELMGYLSGTGLKAYTVSKVTYGDKAGEVPTIKLSVVPTTNVISAAKHHDHNGYIIYNTDAAVNGTKAVGALNNGFHLFVPDMHDRTDGTGKLKPALDVSGNCLRAWLPSNPTTEVMSQTYAYSEDSDGNITATGAGEGVNEYTTYVLSSKGTNTATGKTETDVERFRRVAANVIAGNNKAYLPLLTENVKPKAGASAKGMFAIVFVDEEEGTETTSLNGVESTERTYSDGCYTLDGVKVQNPTKKGIYIKNGKKIIIK